MTCRGVSNITYYKLGMIQISSDMATYRILPGKLMLIVEAARWKLPGAWNLALFEKWA